MGRLVSVIMIGCLLATSGLARAATIGNAVMNRGPGDGATDVLQIYSNSPVGAGGGSIDSFSYFGPTGGSFNLYVLRPAGSTASGDTYQVLFNSGAITSAAGVNTYSSFSPISVQAGDLIGHSGNGISFNSAQPDSVDIYYPQSAPPASGTFTTNTFRNSSFNRTYSLSANVVPEPAMAFGITAMGAGAVLGRRRKAL